jgi:tRNA (guanine37-N1)-methyltransferase
METEAEMNPLRVPIVRSGTILNRALFSKTVNIAAATISNNKDISKYRKALESSKTLLKLDRISPIVPVPDKDLAAQGKKCLLLTPAVKADGRF